MPDSGTGTTPSSSLFSFAQNARSGARTMYVDRWFLRKCIWNRRDGLGRFRGLRNMIFPRLTFHIIYIRKFGWRRWWTA